jgi:hypothetical protein
VLKKSLPEALAALLDELLQIRLENKKRVIPQPKKKEDGDRRRLGPLKRRNVAEND